MLDFVSQIFTRFKEMMKEFSSDDDTSEFHPRAHQKILRADEKLRSGDRRAVEGSVKFTAKHLFECKCAIVRRTLKKPRVVK